jgi:UDP-N-acetylmuramate dehydrogenase
VTALELLGDAGVLRRDVSLAPLTTYRFGGAAKFYADVESVATLRQVLSARHTESGLPLLVLGRGSNVVVSDAGFPGLVVRLVGEFRDVAVGEDGDVSAGAAASLPRLARDTVKAGRGGLEWCVGIPGTVGGAVRMNAGGHGSDTAAWLRSAEVMSSATLEPTTWLLADLGLSYRHSELTDDDIVTRARFRTIERHPSEGERLLRDITRWRRENQPGGTLNAGSVFKNPPGDAAGRLIDFVGLKGYRVGGAAVSARHANFFEADATATAQNVYNLVWDVRERVYEATGIALEPEIRFVGSFESPENRAAQ